MKKTQNIMIYKNTALIVLVLVALLIASPALTGTSYANLEDIQKGIDATGSGPAGVSVEGIITNVINIFSFIIGIIAVIMIIIGGLKYITSTGDSGKVESAKNTIIYAVVGLVIVALAQVIVRFVLGRVVS